MQLYERKRQELGRMIQIIDRWVNRIEGTTPPQSIFVKTTNLVLGGLRHS